MLARLPRQRSDDLLEIKATKPSQAQPNSQRATRRGRRSGGRGGPSASADLSVEPTTKVNQLFSGILLSSAGLQLKQSDWRDLQPGGGKMIDAAAAVMNLKIKRWNPLAELN